MKERFNVGYGKPWQRLLRLIDSCVNHHNVVTKHVCRNILRDKFRRWLKRLSWVSKH